MPLANRRVMKLQRYARRQGEFGVLRCAVGPRGIAVESVDGSSYFYDQERPGCAHVSEMKLPARAGEGLSSYVSRSVHDRHTGKRC